MSITCAKRIWIFLKPIALPDVRSAPVADGFGMGFGSADALGRPLAIGSGKTLNRRLTWHAVVIRYLIMVEDV